MNIRKRFGVILIFLLAASLIGFLGWANTPARPMPAAYQALESSSGTAEGEEGWWVFRPQEGKPTTGLIIYPGGRVDPRAYAPAVSAIAQRGFLVVVVPMPLNLAVFAPMRAADVQAAFPEIRAWAVGGHSLGGAMASNYAYRQPEAVDGLVLWAAYPAESNDLSGSGLAVLSIFATRDGLASAEKINASRRLLPSNTAWEVIEGGNHAQFGWYGEQAGDLPAAIDRVDQEWQVVDATVRFLSRLEMNG